MKDTAVCVSFWCLLDVYGAKGRHFGRYLASFLQVEFVGCWSATESDAWSGQVRGFVWWSLEAFRGLIIIDRQTDRPTNHRAQPVIEVLCRT